VLVKARGAEVTGVLVVKYAREEWRGSLVNEFGVKAFDFVAPGGKCRLRNVAPFLDRWYVRGTIAADFSFLCGRGTGKGRRMERADNGAFTLTNEKRGIVYSFQPVRL
jgi:hypothetical protein